MTQAPQIRNSKTGTIVRHVEFIQNIAGTEDFSLFSLGLNPGLDGTFPWLSQIAPAFEQYKWRGLVFTYKTTSADLVTGTNGALGQVIMATDYDSTDADYSNQREMLNSEYAKSAKPSVSFVHPIETARRETPYKLFYTREGPPPANADIRLYDIGKFEIATQGMQATGGTIGQLWVSYEIEFLKPQFKLDVGVEGDQFSVQAVGPNVPFPPDMTRIAGNLGFTRISNGSLECPQDSEGKKFQLVFYFEKTVASAATTTQFEIDESPASGRQSVIPIRTTFNGTTLVGYTYHNSSAPTTRMFLITNFVVPAFSNPLEPPIVNLINVSGGSDMPTGTLVCGGYYITEIPQSYA